MPVSDRNKQRNESVSSLLRLLSAKYEREPERFREFLPDVAQLLDTTFSAKRGKRVSVDLTERERQRRAESLNDAIGKLRTNGLDQAAAVRAIEDVAVLSLDNAIPVPMGYEERARLLKTALGQGISSFKAKQTVNVSDGQVAHEAALIRGVWLNLTWDMKLVSVSVTPERVRQRKQLLAFVGVGKDVSRDVAAKHDHYLDQSSRHGAA